MSLNAEQLYELLPAIYRIRDTGQGGQLKALVAVIAGQAAVMEADIAGLYENWFIETCDEWVVPYIGDLLAVRGLHALAGAPFSQRALVANTLGYRRRKGTPAVLEQFAHDTTGWNARAGEFFELLETTQHYNHIRLKNHRTPDLRQTNELELIDTAFDKAAHTADVRHIATGRGLHNIPSIGLYMWRLQSYSVSLSAANEVASPGGGCYRFNPLGRDGPLFNPPQSETDITHLAEESNVPGVLRRLPLYEELEALRQARVDGGDTVPVYFGSQPVLQVFVRSNPGDPFLPVPPEEILISNLIESAVASPDLWRRPRKRKLYRPGAGGPRRVLPIKVAVDPLLGRLAFPRRHTPDAVKVSYAYGFSGDVGGGPYDRRESVVAILKSKAEHIWQIGVSKEIASSPETIVPTLADALTLWNLEQVKPDAKKVGVIAIMDSQTYAGNLQGINRIEIPEGSQLFILAAGWPQPRIAGSLEPKELRPHLKGDTSIVGTAPAGSKTPGELVLNGLLIEGALSVDGAPGESLGSLRLDHCTQISSTGKLSAGSNNSSLRIVVNRSITGPIALQEPVPHLRVEESIVDGASGQAIGGKGTAVEIEKSTVFGSTSAFLIEAGNSIFTDKISVVRKQAGCVRFSYVPPGSDTPGRFRCQPDLVLVNAGAQEAAVRARLTPSFTSERFGDSAYGQLSLACAVEVRTGAEDGSEMGVFSFLKQPQRITNLQTGLDEYLRFGLEAGVIFAT